MTPLFSHPPWNAGSYETVRVVGNGSFGVVFQATCLESGDTVAIKKVLQAGAYTRPPLSST